MDFRFRIHLLAVRLQTRLADQGSGRRRYVLGLLIPEMIAYPTLLARLPRQGLTRTPSCSCRVDWCSGRCLARSIYPEERPTHRVAMSGFWMDSHPVNNAEFRRLLKAAGHVTLAERPPNGADYPPYPTSLDELRAAGMPAVVELQLWTGRDRQSCP